MPQRVARWRVWLEDEEIRLWFENNARGSPAFAEESIRALYRYCAWIKTTPQDLVAQAKKDLRVVENQLLKVVGDLERKGRSPSYIQNFVKYLRSYLAHYGIPWTRKIKVTHQGATPTLDNERVPTREELRSVLGNATARGRVIASLIVFSGLRPEVLGDLRGRDGLRLGDLPELKILGKEVVFEKVPCQVKVRRTLSKAKHAYFTFLSSEGCDALKAYLEQRLAAGEAMDEKTPVVRVTEGWESKARHDGSQRSPFIVSRNISREVREAMRPRYQWRPYVLRCYFDTQLLLAESNGKISHAYRAFFMGHKGDIEARYTTNKGRLPTEMIEDMRLRYRDSEQFLGTSGSHVTDVKDMLLKAWRDQARAYGIDPMRIRVELEAKGGEPSPDQEIQALTLAIARHAAPPAAPAARQTKVVKGDEELVQHMNQGWTLTANLGAGKYLIQAAA
jgi:integrase